MGPVGKAYAALVAAGELKPDPDQSRAVQALDRFGHDAAGNGGGFLKKLFGKKERQRGVYLWGGVGRGKSMLMDLAFDNIEIERKRRTHFHAFMLDVHQRLREARKSEDGDPVIRVAHDIAEEVKFLAFDEMMVTNSADAMIMSRLFTAMIDEGVAIVTTSNRLPRDLYKDGLNRERFLPCIDLIERTLEVLPLNGPTDYRLDRIGGMKAWHSPVGDEATAQLRELFFRLTDYPPEDAAHVPSAELELGGGRTLLVPKSLKGVAVFSFKRLCGEPRGAADYLAVARTYHTVIIVGIPLMGPEMRNEAARFVTLIDALYENKVKLLASAAAEPEDLYPAGDGRFEFERTVSRLNEMQSAEYMAEGHGEV